LGEISTKTKKSRSIFHEKVGTSIFPQHTHFVQHLLLGESIMEGVPKKTHMVEADLSKEGSVRRTFWFKSRRRNAGFRGFLSLDASSSIGVLSAETEHWASVSTWY